ncbi:hypothetical protein TNCV_1565441 [Trichonephila clavipes]|nr:hypothetical protein TNCV_1565441 [Trichonephila clavipes]
MIVQLRNEKVSNHGSIPITIDCNVVAFIVFEEGFHQPIKRTSQFFWMKIRLFEEVNYFVELVSLPKIIERKMKQEEDVCFYLILLLEDVQ